MRPEQEQVLEAQLRLRAGGLCLFSSPSVGLWALGFWLVLRIARSVDNVERNEASDAVDGVRTCTLSDRPAGGCTGVSGN